MTQIALEDCGLPECPPVDWMEAVRALGWDGGGYVEPKPRDIALWYDVNRREFAIVTDVAWSEKPPTFRLIEGVPTELATWVEENRPEYAAAVVDDGTPCHSTRVYADLREYADDPEREAAWWKLCDDVRAGDIGLAVDVGDA